MEQCPSCKAKFNSEPLSNLESGDVYIASEVGIWILAGIASIVFSICDFTNAYAIGIVVFCFLFAAGYQFLKVVNCNGCGKSYSRHELTKKSRR